MKTHKLKIKPEYLEEIKEERKKSEIRLNDRDYQKDDYLEFTDYSEFDSPKTIECRITHVHSGLGLERNYVVLSVELIKPKK